MMIARWATAVLFSLAIITTCTAAEEQQEAEPINFSETILPEAYLQQLIETGVIKQAEDKEAQVGIQSCPPPSSICRCGVSYRCCNSDEKCGCQGGLAPVCVR